MGLQQAFVGVGGTIFLTGGGFLAEMHWRAPFLIYALAFLVLPAVLLFITEPVRAAAAAKMPGQAGQLGARGVILLAMLFAAAVFNMIVFYMIPTQLPFFLKDIGVAAPSLAGVAIGVGQAIGVVSSLFFARFRRILGIMGVFALAFGSMGSAFLIFSVSEHYAGVLVGMAVSGIGMGTIMPNFAAAAMMLAPPQSRGRISGLLVSSIFLGQFLSPLVSQPVIAASGYATAYGLAGLAAVTIAFGSLAARLTAGTMAMRREGGG